MKRCRRSTRGALNDGRACLVSGKAGEELVCPLSLLHCSPAQAQVTTLEMLIQYPAGKVQLLGFQDTKCVAPDNCVPLPVPPNTLDPSGHNVFTKPPPGEWKGEVSVNVVHLTTPNSVVSGAFIDKNGQLAGNPEFIQARLKLLADIPEAAPGLVLFGGLKLTAQSGNAAPFTLEPAMILVGECN